MSLLPSHHDQFRNKDYWDRFFQERGGEQFEWYGSYKDVETNVRKSIKPTDRILVVGCGNSEFSSELYDNGFRAIRNLDFSPLVIEEMKGKHQAIRPEMSWDLEDMTAMTYSDGAFDVVFDKGALDALMSTNDAETVQKANLMFKEIHRVLAAGGKYVCITLAEDFILKTLVSGFTGGMKAAGMKETVWDVDVEVIRNQKPSPFIPFYIIMTKAVGVAAGSGSIRLRVDTLGNETAAPQIVTPAAAIEKIPRIQEYHQKQFELGQLRIGRFETIDFWSPDAPQLQIPRFTITLLDVSTIAMRWCAVFFVPSGRESEFQFATQEGLSQIAAQAQCRRLIVVRCNRPHIFPPMDQLQAELSPIATSLKPRDTPVDEVVPYMALEADGNWETIESGTASGSGEYIVEEDEDEDVPNAVIRRLVFLQNQNFIQTEVRLVPPKKPSGGGGGGGGGKGKSSKGKGKSGAKGNSGEQQQLLDFDYSYMDNHHRAVLSSLVLSQDLITQGQRVQPAGGSRTAKGFIVGLGGGAFPMGLQRYLPGLSLWVCDLDPDMEGIATRQFGFKKNARTATIVGDGMELIYSLRDVIKQTAKLPPSPPTNGTITAAIATATAAAAAAETAGGGGSTSTGSSTGTAPPAAMQDALDFMFIDADSKDPSLGLSAPPKAFITPVALSAMHGVMRPGGLLAINVAARSAGLLDDFVRSIHIVFTALDAVDDHNIRNPTSPYNESEVEKLVDRLATASTGGDDNNAGGKKEEKKPIQVIGHIDALLAAKRSNKTNTAAGLAGLETALKKLTLDGPIAHAAVTAAGAAAAAVTAAGAVSRQGKASSSTTTTTAVVRQKTPIGGSRVFLLRPATDTANVVVLVLKGDPAVRQRYGTSYGDDGQPSAASSNTGTITASAPVLTSSNSSSTTAKSKGKGGGAAASASALGAVDPWLPESRTVVARERYLEDWLKNINMSSDPLELASLSEKLLEI